MIHFVRTYVGVLILLTAVSGKAATVHGVEESRHVFAGNEARVSVVLASNAAWEDEVLFRLHRLAGRIAAPVGAEKSAGVVSLGADRSVTLTVPIAIPEETSRAEYRLSWRGKSHGQLGSTQLTVWPGHALDELTSLANGVTVYLHDPDRLVLEVIEKANIPFRRLEEARDLRDIRPPVLVVTTAARGSSGAIENETVARRGLHLLRFDPDETGSEALTPRWRTQRFDRARVHSVPRAWLEDFSESPLGQKRFAAIVKAVAVEDLDFKPIP